MATVMSMFIFNLLQITKRKYGFYVWKSREKSFILQNLPWKILIDLIFVLHPCVSVHKELQEGQKCHGAESYKGHCRRDSRTCYPSVTTLKKQNKTKEVSPTCSSGGRGLHVALGHFGEGVQLFHQAQGFLARKTPHLYVQGCHRRISIRIRTPPLVYIGFSTERNTHLPNQSYRHLDDLFKFLKKKLFGFLCTVNEKLI